jgi:type IV secretory pathway ATPase VirB11/archaellum biosynthesis ATPase
MANKLAGQKMKFTKARTTYYSSDDEVLKTNAVRQMAEVLAWAQGSGISEAEVTQNYEFPDEVRRATVVPEEITEADADHFVKVVAETVDQSGVQTIGSGAQCVYAYGYRYAPDR